MKTPPAPAHILLVDDNPDGLLVRRLLIEEMGCCVEVASDGEEGLKLFESSRFDLLVVDYRMPRMSGVEMIARVRARDATARIILLSGFVEALGLTEENTGADAVVAKNAAEPVHLPRSIKRLLNRAPARKPPASQKAAAARARAAAR